MLARRYYSELRRCLGPDDAGLRHLELLADRASPRFEDIADKIAFLLAGKETSSQSRRELANTLYDVLLRLCSRESAARALTRLANEAKLGVSDLVGVVGLLHSELEHVAQTTFTEEEAYIVQAAIGRRVVMELSLLHAPAARDSKIVESDAAEGKDKDGASQSAIPAIHTREKAARKVAHEVRNALNGAILHLTFLERKLEDLDADDEALDAAQIIGREINRVAGLIDESLDLERTSAPGEAATSVKSLCTQTLRQVSAVLDDESSRAADGHGRGIEGVLLELMQDVTETALQHGGKVLMTARRDCNDAVIEIEHGPLSDATWSASSAWSSGTSSFAVAMQTIAACGGSLRVETAPGRTIFHVQFPSTVEQQVVNH